MFVTIINDCRDSNAVGRQSTRIASLFCTPPSFVGVGTDLEAAGNLIDALDAAEDREGVILVNVAPRHGAAKKWPNGTPFGYFRHKKTLVVTSIDGLTLSLVRKLRLSDHVKVLDMPAEFATCQFRSYEFLPKAAKWLTDGVALQHQTVPIESFADALPAVWFVDNFGNCKTTILAQEAADDRSSVSLAGTLVPRYKYLKDVPDGSPALIVGSSGIGSKRFLEVVIQGGNAAHRFRLASGDRMNYFSCELRPPAVS